MGFCNIKHDRVKYQGKHGLGVFDWKKTGTFNDTLKMYIFDTHLYTFTKIRNYYFCGIYVFRRVYSFINQYPSKLPPASDDI